MSEAEIKALSRSFEIGGHTLTHARLGALTKQRIYDEVNGCYQWLTEILGVVPVSFCFPGGIYNAATVKQAVNVGFKVLRTTELLSVETVEGSLAPTTLQLYEHKKFTYLKHLIKRGKLNNTLVWLKSMASSDLIRLVNFYIAKIDKEGGCLHIWGHSWEIEQFGLWEKLELIFKQISNMAEFDYVLNKHLQFNEAGKND